MIDKIKITILQTDIIWESKEQNFERYEAFIKCNDLKHTLLVLPEMFATGFSMDVESLGETMEGLTMNWMKAMAVKYDISICGSFIAIDNGAYFNRMVLVTAEEPIQYYDKRHLFRMGEENQHYSAGEKQLLFDYKGWKIKPMVCYDLRFPVWARNRFEQGIAEYDCLVYIANWPQARSHAWKTLLAARAIENQCYVVGVNRVGEDGNGLKYSGDSAVINPQGVNLTDIKPSEEAMVTVELKSADLHDYRKAFPVGLDADRFEII